MAINNRLLACKTSSEWGRDGASTTGVTTEEGKKGEESGGVPGPVAKNGGCGGSVLRGATRRKE
jgi:hypothetical protein